MRVRQYWAMNEEEKQELLPREMCVEMVFDNYIHFEYNNRQQQLSEQEKDAKVFPENIHHLVSLSVLTSRYWSPVTQVCASLDMLQCFSLDMLSCKLGWI